MPECFFQVFKWVQPIEGFIHHQCLSSSFLIYLPASKFIWYSFDLYHLPQSSSVLSIFAAKCRFSSFSSSWAVLYIKTHNFLYPQICSWNSLSSCQILVVGTCVAVNTGVQLSLQISACVFGQIPRAKIPESDGCPTYKRLDWSPDHLSQWLKSVDIPITGIWYIKTLYP